MRIIHTSDLHLGKSNFKKELETLERIFYFSIKLKADFILIAGDLFDNYKQKKEIRKEIIKQFKILEDKKIKVFIVTGDHDPYRNNSIWGSNFPDNVIIFKKQGFYSIKIKGGIIYGSSFLSNEKEFNPLKNFRANKSRKAIKIGILHAMPKNKSNIKEKFNVVFNKGDIDLSGLDYLALGHFHDFTKIKTKTPCFYPGSPIKKRTYTNTVPSIILAEFFKNKKIIKRVKIK